MLIIRILVLQGNSRDVLIVWGDILIPVRWLSLPRGCHRVICLRGLTALGFQVDCMFGMITGDFQAHFLGICNRMLNNLTVKYLCYSYLCAFSLEGGWDKLHAINFQPNTPWMITCLFAELSRSLTQSKRDSFKMKAEISGFYLASSYLMGLSQKSVWVFCLFVSKRSF
jgi:hypothetical protein